MAATTTLLGLVTPTQGTLSGTWGDTVNYGISDYVDIAVAGTLTLTGDGAVTLANTTGSSSGSNITSTLAGAGTVTAQFSTVRVSGTTTTKVVTGPSYSKSYLVDNASSFAVTFKASGQTGVSISPSEKVYVYYNATDYVKVGGGGITYGAVKTTTYTAVANDGVLTNTTGGAFTVNLPATPATGTQVFIADSAGTWATNNLTIGRNGSTIAGSATDLVCDINSVSIQCIYDGTTWDIFAQIGANDTAVVTLNGTQTLTNKTLTSPTITGTGAIAAATVTLSSTLSVTGVSTLTGGAVIQGMTVGRGAGAVSSNTAVGASALGANTSGSANSAFGQFALFATTTGVDNTGLGRSAMESNTTGTTNTAIGRSALYTNTTGSSNVAVGMQSLFANTTASNNTAVGYQAGYSNTTGTINTSLGVLAGYSNSTSNAVTAIGGYVLQSNTAAYNTGVGYNALNANTTGESNVAVGSANATTSAALRSNTTGSFNSAFGVGALGNNTTASNNTAVGYSAMRDNTTGAGNAAFGRFALIQNTTANNNAAFGQGAMFSNTTGANNTGVGTDALATSTTASDNTAVGYQSMYYTTTGYANAAVGENALKANTTGYNSVSVGYNSLSNNTTGVQNTAVGMAAGAAVTTGGGNALLGYNAGANITTGASNVCLGQSTGVGTPFGLFNLTTQNDRVIIGSGNTTNAYVQVAWTVVSDLRDKIVLGDVPHGLDFVRKLKPIKYQFKESRESNTPHGVVKYGFGAQDVLAVEGDNPVIVDTEQLEKLKITDSHMMPVFANAIKEMADMIDQLKAEIATLKGN